jgi:metal-sulfur cluster biosynthetic enzyme
MGETNGHDGGPLRAEVLNALKGIACCDFRLGVGQLGLVQDAQVSEDGAVSVKVLPCCIFGMTRLVTSVKEGLEKIEGATNVEVEVAWDHVWDRSRMSQEGRQTLQLDLKGMAEKQGLKAWGAS